MRRFAGKCALCYVVLFATAAFAADGFKDNALIVVDKLPAERAVLRDGTPIDVEVDRVWKPICGSDPSQISKEQFARIIDDVRRAIDTEPVTVVQAARAGGGGIDIVFSVIGSIPSAAAAALIDVEAFLETQFTDPITVTVSFRMFSMGPGVLGSTGISSVFVDYPIVRDALRADMDVDDVIQDWLPDTDTLPVRYNGSSATVTAETRVHVSRANYNATIGSLGGAAGTIQLNTDFSWDYDPSNGVPGNLVDFQSVLIHEIGHALGFASGVDFLTNDIEMLDLYRFQRTDGAGDYNPDDLNEFQTTPRTVDFNNPNDDANSDIIEAEYRMSDGDPYQASHFREQSIPVIGIMDPALGFGQSFYPNFYRTADLNMLDAIGWDYIRCSDNPALDDLNSNGIADICERNPPRPESSGSNCAACVGMSVCVDDVCYVPKNRYLSLMPDNPGSMTALRVTHIGSGAAMWVGEPDGNGFATLVDAPEYRDWSDYAPVIHVGGCFIVPEAPYDVQSLLDIDDPQDEGSYSPALALPTVAPWGDVTGTGDVPDGTANFSDISALVACFTLSVNALPRERCDIAGQSPDGITNFVDINNGVTAFQGADYPYSTPDSCP